MTARPSVGPPAGAGDRSSAGSPTRSSAGSAGSAVRPSAGPAVGPGGGPLFSEGWLRAAAALAADAAFPPAAAAALAVEYRCAAPGGEVRHHQRFAGGRLVAWERGALPGADLRLRQTLRANVALLTRRGLGNAVLRETAVETAARPPGTGAPTEAGAPTAAGGPSGGPAGGPSRGPDGRGEPGPVRRLPPPPLDEVLGDWGGRLPEIRTVPTITVQQVLVDSPFGTVSTWHRLERARVVESGLGAVAADVVARRRYADALAERAGALDVLESIVRGEIGGDIKLLAMFLGIYDDDACRRARRALTTPALRPLARLGEVLSSPAWAAVAEGLAATLPAAAGQPRTQADPDV